MTDLFGRAWLKLQLTAGVVVGEMLPRAAVPLTPSALIAVTGLLGLLGCAESPKVVVHAVPPPQVQASRWFNGEDGMHVEALDFADGSSLVRVSGVDSALTGKVLSYKRVQDGDRFEYRTKWHGRDWYALVKERSGQWMAYLPGSRDGYRLSYAETMTARVDSPGLQRLHSEQEQSGELNALQRFDRAAEQKGEETALTEESQRTGQACGKAVPISVHWPSVSDQQLMERSVSGYCESVLSALQHLCDSQAGKRFVAEQVSSVECTLDGDNSLRVEGQKLRWAINFDISNASDKAYASLLAWQPAAQKHTLQAQILAEQTAVCSDADHKHVVLVGPSEAPHKGLAYGDGKQFWWVATPQQLGEGWFFDPRQRNDKNNDNFRGLDLRLFSHVNADLKAGKCALTCGAREVALQLVSGAAKDAILEVASFQPSPHQREPYALARDNTGTYYFVDRGATEETARDFRLFRGKRGQLRPLAMKDVVSDSEGEIFASTNGQLRLLVGKQAAQWIAGATANLQLLPVQQNFGLIYNELGVYLSSKLGVPCDDL